MISEDTWYLPGHKIQNVCPCKETERYSRRVSMDKIEKKNYNLNISRYISTAIPEPEIDLKAVNKDLVKLEKNIVEATEKHNEFLKELGVPVLPLGSQKKEI